MALLLRESHLRELLVMRDLIPLMAQTLAGFSTGGAVQPVRSMVPVERHGGFLGVMPAYLAPSAPPAGPDSTEALGLKAVAFYPGNAGRSLPTHLATVLLLDPATGALRALLDGRLITEMRTAAVSAAATDRLARRGARVLAVLGAGVQARSHIEALREVRPPAEVRVWNRTQASADRLASDTRARFGLTVAVSASAEQAVRGAEIVCTVTGSTAPVVEEPWLSPGTHLNAVGAARPDWRELTTGVVRRAKLFVDSRAAALTEAGDVIGPIREGAITEGHIAAEIGEVFAGRHAGRERDGDITLFKSVGMAVEDVATARFAFARAEARGIGEEIRLE
ncbi:MAG TPA: ornithine cyclodeaminase family protein [bacterium]|nr:ornithine cyclodeaminase family protein [bacterium]